MVFMGLAGSPRMVLSINFTVLTNIAWAVGTPEFTALILVRKLYMSRSTSNGLRPNRWSPSRWRYGVVRAEKNPIALSHSIPSVQQYSDTLRNPHFPRKRILSMIYFMLVLPPGDSELKVKSEITYRARYRDCNGWPLNGLTRQEPADLIG